MQRIKILTLEDTKKVLTMESVIQVVEKAYREKAEGKASVFPMVTHEFDPGKADMDIKSGDIGGLNAFGLKMVAWYGDNPSKGLPALTGVVMMFDDRTGLPLGVINAGHMTGMRTGAAGAIGIKYLSREDSETMLMVGAGTQAVYQVRGALTVRPGLKKIYVYDPMGREFADRFIQRMSEAFREAEKMGEYYPSVSMEAVSDLPEAVRRSDIIVTATPSHEPIVMKEWIRAGAHFSCMGSDMSGKQEIDEQIVAGACLVADDRAQCVSVGETETAYKKGLVSDADIRAEIGEIIAGIKPGRTSETETTVFDSTGIGLQDIAAGALAFRRADELGIGTTVEF